MNDYHGRVPKFVRARIDSLSGSKPVDTGIVRDAIINNQEILEVGRGQIRVNIGWDTPMVIPIESGFNAGLIAYYEFPLSFLPNGQHMPLQTMVAVSADGIAGSKIQLQFEIFQVPNIAPSTVRGMSPETQKGVLSVTAGDPPTWQTINNNAGGSALWVPYDNVKYYRTKKSFDSTNQVPIEGYNCVFKVSSLGTTSGTVTNIKLQGLFIKECSIYDFAEV